MAKAGEPLPFPEGFLDKYREALRTFQVGDFAKSLALFEEAGRIRPGDGPCATYIDTCRAFMQDPPDRSGWRGVVPLHEK